MLPSSQIDRNVDRNLPPSALKTAARYGQTRAPGSKHQVIGSSLALQAAVSRAIPTARTGADILIEAESGTTSSPEIA